MWKKTVLAVSCLLLASGNAVADCSNRIEGRSPAPGSDICIYTNNYPDDTHMINAANRWNEACGGGDTMPSLNVGGCSGTSIVIDVVYYDGSRRITIRPAESFNLLPVVL